jgi:hypothetical protein
MTASFDTDREVQVATNQGWDDFVRWTMALEPGIYPEVQHLAVYGWGQDLGALGQELDEALAEEAPDDLTVAGTAQGLLAFILSDTRGKAGAITISNGVALEEAESDTHP